MRAIQIVYEYIREIVLGLWHLLQGMYVSMKNFIRPKVTEQYPENRGKHLYPAAFRAELVMPHDADNHHKCTACGICMMNCPNGTIEVISKNEMDPATGRPRKVLDKHLYNIGSCIFCALCTQTCPQDAIAWTNHFEHSVFDRAVLVQRLNRPGSSLLPKAPAAPKPATTTPNTDSPADAVGTVPDHPKLA